MGYFLFVDESGQDHKASPYEVLTGVAIEDREIWPFIQQLHALEEKHFGMRVSNGELELKGKKILKAKVFRHAQQLPAFSIEERKILANSCIMKGKTHEPPTRKELTAFGQAKIAFVQDVLTLCAQNRIKAFASIVDISAPQPSEKTILRKDYAFLFERYFYFLEDTQASPMGVIVFDELEKSQSHILVDQMEKYFLQTTTGRARSSHIIPEPFFVHSDLTTLIQVADLVAYIISWGVRVHSMTKPARPELADLGRQVCALRYRAYRERGGFDNFSIWSFAVIDDLRPISERH